MKRRHILLCLLSFWACPAAGGEPLTWERAVAMARENNPDLKAARASVEQDRARYRALYGDFLPQVTASAGYDRSGSGGSDSEDYSLGLSARQNLFAGLQDKHELERGRRDLEASEASYELVSAQVAFDLRAS